MGEFRTKIVFETTSFANYLPHLHNKFLIESIFHSLFIKFAWGLYFSIITNNDTILIMKFHPKKFIFIIT